MQTIPNECKPLPTKFRKCSLREKCPYSELFWPVFSHIQSECGKVRTRIAPNKDTFHAECF